MYQHIWIIIVDCSAWCYLLWNYVMFRSFSKLVNVCFPAKLMLGSWEMTFSKGAKNQLSCKKLLWLRAKVDLSSVSCLSLHGASFRSVCVSICGGRGRGSHLVSLGVFNPAGVRRGKRSVARCIVTQYHADLFSQSHVTHRVPFLVWMHFLHDTLLNPVISVCISSHTLADYNWLAFVFHVGFVRVPPFLECLRYKSKVVPLLHSW